MNGMMMANTYEKVSITTEACKEMINTAQLKALELGLAVSITIVDESGIQKAFSRMDNAPLIGVKASLKKALTAVGFGMPSGDTWFKFIENDPILREGVHNFDDFILLGGGSPIIIGGKVVGAIGISGGHYKHDEECVKAALSVV